MPAPPPDPFTCQDCHNRDPWWYCPDCGIGYCVTCKHLHTHPTENEQ